LCLKEKAVYPPVDCSEQSTGHFKMERIHHP
jgi:hypothetical protein